MPVRADTYGYFFSKKEINSMNIIETENLTKTYKRYKKEEGIFGSIKGLWKREYEEKNAVDSVSLKIKEGESIGLIGPNGAAGESLS